ncbi:hypothetical protein FRC09_006921 [Ceratobasidium sp. 395]|nr:hypothetical protein FRC09_006921 [Ceratobasidium sp. 395]
MIVETQRMEQLEAREVQTEKDLEHAFERMEQTKSFEELKARAVTDRQHLHQLESQISELQQDNSAALQARTKLQTSIKTLKQSVEAAEARLNAVDPLSGHVGALVSIADKQTQLVLLARNFEQARASSGCVDNVFLGCYATQTEVKSLQIDLESLKKRGDPTETVEALAVEVGSLRPLVDRVAKVEEQTATLSSQTTLLENVDKVQDKVSKLESEHKVFQGKLSSSAKSLRTEIFEVKTKAEDALRLANETAPSVDQLLPLKSHITALTALSGQSEQLLALGKQAEATETGMAKLLSAHEKSTRRYNELVDSVAVLEKTIEGTERKANDAEIGVAKLGEDFKGEKEAWTVKIRTMEAEISRLLPLEQYSGAIIGLATPSGSPMSPTQRTPSTPDSRVALLERSAESAKRELKNIAQHLTRVDGKMNGFKEQLTAANGRIADLSAPVQTDTSALSPLISCVPALVTIANQETAYNRLPEYLKALGGIARRMNTVESDLKDLAPRVPAVEQFELMTEFLVEVPNLKKLAPLGSQIDSALLLISHVETITSLVDQAESLIPLVQRVENLEPLSSKVEKLLPLRSRVADLHASITELRKDVAGANARSQPRTSGQPSSLVVDEPQLPPISFLPQPSSPATMLRSSPDLEPSSRPSKKRKLEETVESIEEQLESMRNEVDSVAWDVAEMEKRLSSPKRLRTSRSLPPSRESGEITESDLSQAQENDGSTHVWRMKVDTDLDYLRGVLLQLRLGEGDWPERLEAALERAWEKSSRISENQGGTTVPALAGQLNALSSDIQVLKLALEAQGPGTIALGSSSVDAMMERITGRVLEQMSEHHESFKSELEQVVSNTVKPVKDMFHAIKMIK